MGVLLDSVMRLAGLVSRIDVSDYERQIIKIVEEPMADLSGDRVRLRDCHPGKSWYCDVSLAIQDGDVH
jgi:hypothetical protein